MIKPYLKDGKKCYEVYLCVRDKSGKQVARRKRGISSEREAREVEFRYKVELTQAAESDTIWTWQTWFEECLRRMKTTHKQTTLSNYEGRLKKWIPEDWKFKKINEFTNPDILDLMDRIAQSDFPVSQKYILKMVRRIFSMAVDDGIIARNPAARVRIHSPKPIQKVLTASEAEMLLSSAKTVNHEFYPVWAFALLTGMRSGEMYALKWSDINMEAGIISLTKAWTKGVGLGETKTRDHRVVPICSDLKDLLVELKRGSKSEFVLPRPRMWQLGLQAGVLRQFCRSIGITEIKFHDLRATFITNMLAQGVPLVKVMSIVGHQKMATTDIYLRLAGVDVQGSTEKLGFSLPKAVSDNGEIVPFRRRGV